MRWPAGECTSFALDDDLARRAASVALPVCRPLGLNVGLITPDMPPKPRRDSYLADITISSIHEFAYDYIRDNLAWELTDRVQSELDCALVADADAILLDESRTRYVISGPTKGEVSWHERCARLADVLVHGRHYEYDDISRVVSISDEGAAVAATELGVDDVFDPATPVIYALRAALRVKHSFVRGTHYDVIDGRIQVLDSNTGATRPGRMSDDLTHQAIEAKEGLAVSAPTIVVGRITTWGYLTRYRVLAGVSPVAIRESDVLKRLYGVEVITARPRVRATNDYRGFPTDDAKYDAIVAAALELHNAGRPVIIGAVTVHDADQVRQRLGIHLPVVTALNCRSMDAVPDEPSVLVAGRHPFARHDDLFRELAGAGSCTFFVSADDMDNIDDDLKVDMHVVTSAYANVLDEQCHEYYTERRRVLGGISEAEFLEYVTGSFPPAHRAQALQAYRERCEQLRPKTIRRPDGPTIGELQRRVLLISYDAHWRDHLATTDMLDDDVVARQITPDERLAEYRQEAAALFTTALHTARKRAVRMFLGQD